MKIHRLYVDQKGESHFEDVEIKYVESSRSGRLSARLPATGIIFREVQPDYDWTGNPRPATDIITSTPRADTASDGESRDRGR